MLSSTVSISNYFHYNSALLQELEAWLALFMNPFNPLPAAACLLDPTIAIWFSSYLNTVICSVHSQYSLARVKMIEKNNKNKQS
jgi:hypothetical protein